MKYCAQNIQILGFKNYNYQQDEKTKKQYLQDWSPIA
jgi:hypothetical protein